VTAPRLAYVLGSTQGGIGRHVAMLAGGCAGAGFAVWVIGPPPVRQLLLAGIAPGSGGPVPAFRGLTIGDRPRPARDVAAAWRLRRLIAAIRPDVVHAHGLRAGALTAIALGPFRGPGPGRGPAAALVVTVHNAAPGRAAAAAMYRLLERVVARRANVVLCVSADLQARMRRLGARETGRAVVPAPAPGPAPGHARQRAQHLPRDVSKDRPVVLAVGRLAPQKGLSTLIAAAGRWRDRRPVPLVAIAGTGPLAADLAADAARLGVTASFLGWRDDVPALLAGADVFVLPSRWEGQPLALQEAMRAGLPVVATDVGGVRELTGDDGALLVRPDDPAALAAAVLRVLDEPALAAALRQAALARAAALPGEPEAVAAALAGYRRLLPPG